MFSFSKKKDSKKRGRSDRSSEENEFGIKIDKGQDDKQLEAELRALAGVDSLPEEEINLNEGEDDVELELLRLVGGGKSKKPPKKAPGPDPPLGEVMADIGDDVDPGEEDDVEVDENDPDLLSELLELTEPDAVGADVEEEEEDDEQESVPSAGESDVMGVLKERLKMYKAAEAKAKESNENSRARRFARGIKTLEDLIKKAKAGKAVSPTDIPPVIALNLKPAPPVQPAGEGDENGTENEMSREPAESEDFSNQMNSKANIESPQADEGSGDIMETLTERLKMYKMAETKAKEAGETTRARRFNRGIKTLEGLIRQANSGKPVAPADIPPAVALNLKPAPPVPPPSEEGEAEAEAEVNEEAEENETNNVDLGEASSNETRVSQEPERNIMDVLSERLQMYKTAEAKAKESGETTRARRFGRGIKTLQDLIKQATAGKPIPQEDIPPPIALNLKPAPLVTRQEEDEPRDPAVERDDLVRSSNPAPSMPPLKFSAVDDVDLDEELLEEELEVPATVLEGLEQRLRMYRKLQERAQEEGNESLADENKKFVRIYLNAIATFKNGGYVDVLGLPAPKGAPPIPIPFYVPEN